MMKGSNLTLALGMLVAATATGCSGRLTFDPRVHDDAATLPSPQTTPDARPPEMPAPPPGKPDAGRPDAAPDPEPEPKPMARVDAGARVDAATRVDAAGRVDAAPAVAACPPGFDVLTEVFKKKCGLCHGASAPAKNVDLVTGGVGARMVNKPSSCDNKPLLSGALSGGKAGGILIEKLEGAVAGCGVQMPAGAPPLSETEMACVNDWAVQAINSALGR
jgi:hypothetical protein